MLSIPRDGGARQSNGRLGGPNLEAGHKEQRTPEAALSILRRCNTPDGGEAVTDFKYYISDLDEPRLAKLVEMVSNPGAWGGKLVSFHLLNALDGLIECARELSNLTGAQKVLRLICTLRQTRAMSHEERQINLDYAKSAIQLGDLEFANDCFTRAFKCAPSNRAEPSHMEILHTVQHLLVMYALQSPVNYSLSLERLDDKLAKLSPEQSKPWERRSPERSESRECQFFRATLFYIGALIHAESQRGTAGNRSTDLEARAGILQALQARPGNAFPELGKLFPLSPDFKFPRLDSSNGPRTEVLTQAYKVLAQLHRFCGDGDGMERAYSVAGMLATDF